MATVLDLDEQQSEPQVKESQQSKKNSDDWNANEILSQHFAQPVRFIIHTLKQYKHNKNRVSALFDFFLTFFLQ